VASKRESSDDVDPLGATLTEQQAYYRARAPEYDQWFLRQGRYDQGPELNQRWFDEVAEVWAALEEARISGDVLEMAAGTGWWTERLAASAGHVTALDSSPEALEIARQ
jgi:ubiquinone/menaquinone biosynthesis C-methylase UbiE